MARVYIREISARRNALLTVTQLPAEILASVFHHLLPVIEIRCYRSSSRDVRADIENGTLDLIAASHVCQRWRQVALEFSALWSIIWMNNTRWMNEMLDRSKDAALSIIHCDWEDPYIIARPGTERHLSNTRENINTILPHLFHTRQPKHLCLQVPFHGPHELFRDVLTLPAPYLEVIEISSMLPRYHDPQSASSVHIVSADFLGQHAPCLRHLTLEGPFSHDTLWRSPVLRGLNSLTLSVEPSHGENAPSSVRLPEVLDALRHMEHLETLSLAFRSYFLRTLQTSSYFVPENLDQDHEPVHLPRLSSFTTSGSLIDVLSVARHLVLKPNVRTDYKVLVTNDDIHGRLANDISLLIRPALPLPHMKTCEIAFFHNADVNFRMKCWDFVRDVTATGDSDIPNVEDDPKPRFSLSLSLVIPEIHQIFQNPPVMQELERATRNLVKSVVMVLPFLQFDELHDLRWMNRWQGLPVRVLNVDDSDSSKVLDTFRTTKRLIFDEFSGDVDILGMAASSRDVFPVLESIHFVTQARTMYDGWSRSVPTTFNAQQVQSISGQLRRVAEKHKLRVLQFHGGLLTAEHKGDFTGIASELLIT